MKPMLAGNVDLGAIDPYVRHYRWVVQQKLDGNRLVIEVDDGSVAVLNRDGEMRRNPVPRRILRQFAALPGRWVFDGELLDEFWLFDLPVAGDAVGPRHTYESRLSVLEQFHAAWHPGPDIRLLATARSETAKRRLVDEVLDGGGEGVMLKCLDAPYRAGKRSSQMLKAKDTKTADVVVREIGVDGHDNCSYGLYQDGRLVPAGSCSLAGKPAVAVGDVIEVRYLYASPEGRLYQPVLVRVRDDKPALDCTTDQLVFTDRTVVDTEEIMPTKKNHPVRYFGTDLGFRAVQRGFWVADRDGQQVTIERRSGDTPGWYAYTPAAPTGTYAGPRAADAAGAVLKESAHSRGEQ